MTSFNIQQHPVCRRSTDQSPKMLSEYARLFQIQENTSVHSPATLDLRTLTGRLRRHWSVWRGKTGIVTSRSRIVLVSFDFVCNARWTIKSQITQSPNTDYIRPISKFGAAYRGTAPLYWLPPWRSFCPLHGYSRRWLHRDSALKFPSKKSYVMKLQSGVLAFKN
jgi:hypothetical protein